MHIPNSVPITALKPKDVVEVTIDRISKKGNAMVGKGSQMLVRGDNLQPGQTLRVEIRRAGSSLLAAEVTEGYPDIVPKIIAEPESDIRVSTAGQGWKELIQSRERREEERLQRMENIRQQHIVDTQERLEKEEAAFEEIKKQAGDSKNNRTLSEVVSKLELAESRDLQEESSPKEEESSQPKRNLNKLLNKKD
jgi:hypothetical protein